MFQAFYTGLSGMFSFSRNLDTVSNNIANMNTPGFRASDTFYKSLTSGSNLENGGSGYGTQISGLGYRFSSGDIRQTGNSTDIAISGQGFFTLLNDGDARYTRAGQFSFNNEGILVDPISGSSVASLDSGGQLQEFDISKLRVLAPEATTEISMSGNLSSGATSHEINGVKMFNSLGEEKEVNIKFSKSTTVTGSWTVKVENTDGTAIHEGEIRFGADGTPLSGFNKLAFNISDSQGGSTSISMNFGDPSSVSDSTSIDSADTSTLKATTKDGSSIANLQKVEFQDNGTLKLTYSNGAVKDGPALAMAFFTDNSALKLVEGTIFKTSDTSGLTYGKAGDGNIGQVVSGSIELSNVDLSKEFADMIILQRGYQANSKLMSVTNQLLDSLYENTRGR